MRRMVVSIFLLCVMMCGASHAAQYRAALVANMDTGQILIKENANQLNYPASLTKIMTVYLTFDALEHGRLHLDDYLIVSNYAAAASPVKLGLSAGSKITVEDAKTLLSGVICGAEPPEAVAERVITTVANRYGVSAEDIKGTRRSKEIVVPRQIAVYVVNHVTNLTLKNIGGIFGGKDHSTVLYSIQSVTDQMKKDISFEHEVTDIMKEFQ